MCARKSNLHGGKGRVGRCCSKLNSNKWVKHAYGSFERCQVRVLVRKSSEVARFYPQAYAGRDVFLRGLVPGVPESLYRNL